MSDTADDGGGGGAPADPRPDLRILETRVLRGANYWAHEPVIRMLVDLGALEALPVEHASPASPTRLLALLPTLEEHACSLGRRGGFLDAAARRDVARPRRRARRAGAPDPGRDATSRHGKTRAAGEHGQYNVIYEYARGAGRPRGRPARGAPWSTTSWRPRPERRLRLPAGAGAADPARRAAAVRAVHAGPHRRGGAAATSRASG